MLTVHPMKNGDPYFSCMVRDADGEQSFYLFVWVCLTANGNPVFSGWLGVLTVNRPSSFFSEDASDGERKPWFSFLAGRAADGEQSCCFFLWVCLSFCFLSVDVSDGEQELCLCLGRKGC